MTAAAQYRRPWLYPKQEAAAFGPERISVTEASTKSGKTTVALAWLYEQAVQGKPGSNYWWVAPVYGQAEIAYRRYKRMIPRAFYVANDSKLTLGLLNGCTLWFKTAEKPDNLYGEDVYAVVLDEASRQREEAWHAIRSTVSHTRGPIRIIGNVKGRKNWAYRMGLRAKQGEPGLAYHRLTWRDAVEAGILQAAEIEQARRDLPAAVFAELYEAEASEDEGNPFGLEHIRACATGELAGTAVCWGWDVASKVDYTAGIALDADGRVARIVREQAPWGETLNVIIRQTGELPAWVDCTGVGDMVVEELRRRDGGQRANFQGFLFTGSNARAGMGSKQALMERLAVGIQERILGLPREGVLNDELESFEYVYTRQGVTYSAPEGMHDDCVVALALAFGCWREAAPRRELQIVSMERESPWRI